MHQSGITISDGLKKEVQSCEEDTNNLFIKLEIENDDFKATGQGVVAGDRAANIEAIAGSLSDGVPCFLLMKNQEEGKNHIWTICFFVPDNSPVRKKMVYASSIGALKDGIGGAKFSEDWAISTIAECTVDEYVKNLDSRSNLDAVKSGEERMNEETAYEELLMDRSKTRAIVGVPIKMADPVVDAITSIRDGTNSHVELILDHKTEILDCTALDDTGLDSLNFPDKEPRYHFVNFKHTKDGEERSKLLFIYYCPGRAPPQLKMFYSTVKSNMLKLFTELEVKDFQNFECDSPEEVSAELMMNEIYPPDSKVKAFKKPSARGRGRAKMGAFKAN